MPDNASRRLVIIGPYPPPHGGVEVHVARLHDYAAGRGALSSVINISRHRSSGHRDVHFPSTGLGVLALLIRLKPDVAHVHIGGDPSVRELLLCVLTGLLPKTVAVVTFHSGGTPESIAGSSRPFRYLLRIALRSVRGLVAVNARIADALRAIHEEAEIRVIPPHSYGHIARALERAARLPERIEAFASSRGPLLVVVGGLEAEYRVGLVLEAAAALVARYPQLGLLVIGDGSLRSGLDDLVARLHLGEHVLMTGDLGHDTTLRAIAEADVMLRMTTFDGDAISVREALHLGTPVVASDNGMRPEGVQLVADVRPETVADAVTAVLGAVRPPAQPELGDTHLASLLGFYDELEAPTTSHPEEDDER